LGQIGLSRSIGSFVSRHRSLILISSQGLDQIATLISTRAGNLAQDIALRPVCFSDHEAWHFL